MNWENIKERNGYIHVEVEGLKIGDCILLEGQEADDQGNIVVDIYKATKDSPVIVQHKPEWTPVCNEGMFVFGKIKFTHKYPEQK
jgi:hypothetical protein